MAVVGEMRRLTIGENTYTISIPTKVSQLTNDSGYTSNIGTITSIKTTAGAHTTINTTSGAVSFNVPTTAAHVNAATSNHAHGNITNGGDITATAPTIANGDQIIINDNSESKITNGPTFDGSTTTKALTPKGTWEAFLKSYTETDPIFSASAAAGITSNDITNWNSKTSNTGTITEIKTTAGAHTTIDVTSGKAEFKVPTHTSHLTNNSDYTTKGYVDTAIANLPEPMIFKGSLGTSGTITSLPTAAAGNEGYTYKVITAGTYASQAAKVGDTFISDGSAWVLIPSGDEPSGTVTSITLKAGTGISINSESAITTSGTRTISHADTSSQDSISNSGRTYIQSITLDSYGHITAISSATESVTDTTYSAGTGLSLSGTTFSANLGFSTSGNNRAVLADSNGKLYVTQKDTNYYHTNGTWNGLKYTATANGGAGELAFTIPTGTTSTTVLRGDHTYTTTIASSSGTNQLTLAANSKYSITAGGTSYIFTTPPNTWRGIKDELTSTSTTDSLSANQGRILNESKLSLTGGNVTGPVTFGDSVTIDEATIGDLIVNGNGSFTNNLQVNTINGVAVGNNPKFTDLNYYHTTGTWTGLTYTFGKAGGAPDLNFTLPITVSTSSPTSSDGNNGDLWFTYTA